jgi:integrase
MARALHKLSDRRVKTAPTGMHSDGGGLWLQVGKTGARSWIFRYAIDGRARAMGLGPLHSVSLVTARQKAAECRSQRVEGIDPLEARAAVRAPIAPVTFRDVALEYVEVKEAGWRNAEHRRQWSATLAEDVFPIIGDVPVASIDTEAVLRVLKPIWNTKTETASRVRGRIEAVLDAAKARGLRTGENPARWRGNLSTILPEKSKVRSATHHAAMDYAAVPAFMATLRTRDGAAARALELLILAAARTGEIVNLRRSEIDTDAALWTIPGERMKARKPHRVPLSAPALAILAALPRNGELVFPGEHKAGAMHDQSMLELLKRMGVDVTVHGFRSAFRDWAGETTNFPNHVVEMALAHAIGNAVEAAYRRGDLFEKRRELMTAWATYCGGSV